MSEKAKQKVEVTMIGGDRLITTQELAEMLGVATNTITRARVYGTTQFPPYIKISKSVRYKLSTVKTWLKNQEERQHTSQAA